MGKHKGIIYAALERLDSLMAIGEKRSEAKAQAQAQGQSTWAFSDGKIHSYQTRTNYQRIVLHFLIWCRAEHGTHYLHEVDEQADVLASLYLQTRVEQGYSAWTLQTERSALRLFFQDRTLAQSVVLPQRRREAIKRSRYPAVRDRHFQPKNWPELLAFLDATGLRREEARDLRVGDIYPRMDGRLVVRVRRGKGGQSREVEVFPGHEEAVLAVVRGRRSEEQVFAGVPGHLDVHAQRRQFAQEFYQHESGRPLPSPEGRLQTNEIDQDAARHVSEELGHHRLDIITTNYIR